MAALTNTAGKDTVFKVRYDTRVPHPHCFFIVSQTCDTSTIMDPPSILLLSVVQVALTKPIVLRVGSSKLFVSSMVG
jgi:hypothetical protein